MDEFSRSILKDEYLAIQTLIDSFDTKSLTIKAWSVTLAASGIGASIISKEPSILLLIGLSSLLFWIIEVTWKSFQYAHYERLGKIEKYFSGELKEIVPLQIGASWNKHFRKGGYKRFFKIMSWKNVHLPHSIIFIISLIQFIISKL
jgi:hypothetical protein